MWASTTTCHDISVGEDIIGKILATVFYFPSGQKRHRKIHKVLMTEGNILSDLHFLFLTFSFLLGLQCYCPRNNLVTKKATTVMHTPACKGCGEGEREELRDFLYIAWSCVILPRILWGCGCNSFFFKQKKGWSTEKLSNLPRITQLESKPRFELRQSESRAWLLTPLITTSHSYTLNKQRSWPEALWK